MHRLNAVFRVVGLVLLAAALFDQLRRPADQRNWQGEVFVVPYDFRLPSVERFKMRWWNPADPRIFTPHVFGVGWSINLYQLQRRFKMLIS